MRQPMVLLTGSYASIVTYQVRRQGYFDMSKKLDKKYEEKSEQSKKERVINKYI